MSSRPDGRATNIDSVSRASTSSTLVREGRTASGITVAEGWYRGRLGFGGGVREVYGPDIAADRPTRLDVRRPCRHGPDRCRLARQLTDPYCRPACTTANTSTLDSARPGWSSARLRRRFVELGCRTRLASATVSSHDDAPPIRRDRGAPRRRGDHDTDGTHHLRLRAEHLRTCPFHRRRRRRHRDHASPRRSARGRRTRAPARCGHAAATDRYILAGDGPETYEPTFTIHGFRYVEVSGLAGHARSGRVPSGRLPLRHGTDRLVRLLGRACSRKFHDNVVWSMRGNFVDVPTDCPQRDERLGWTGDLQVFAPTACFLFDCRSFDRVVAR